MSAPLEGTEAELSAAALMGSVIGEFHRFFDELNTKYQVALSTGSWPRPAETPAAKKSDRRKGKVDENGEKVKRPMTAHNLFIRKAIEEFRAKHTVVPEGSRYLMMANDLWRKLSPEEREQWDLSAKAHPTEGGDVIKQALLHQEAEPTGSQPKSPVQKPKPAAPQLSPDIAVPQSAAAQKRKAKLLEEAGTQMTENGGLSDPDTLKKKKKKKKKKSEVPLIEAV